MKKALLVVCCIIVYMHVNVMVTYGYYKNNKIMVTIIT